MLLFGKSGKLHAEPVTTIGGKTGNQQTVNIADGKGVATKKKVQVPSIRQFLGFFVVEQGEPAEGEIVDLPKIPPGIRTEDTAHDETGMAAAFNEARGVFGYRMRHHNGQ